MTRSAAMLAGGVVAMLMAVGGLATWLAAPTDGQPDDAQRLALGQQVYTAHCAACHGARLEGQPDWQRRGPDGLLPAPPHDASGHTWHHDDALLFAITKHGVAQAAGLPGYRSAMPVYDGVLSDAEIVAALSWIKAQWPADIRARHDEINRRAARTR